LKNNQQPKSIAANVREQLTRLDWTQRRLSRETGIGKTTISRICKGGAGSSSTDRIKRIADALNVPIEQLIGHAQVRREGTSKPRTADIAMQVGRLVEHFLTCSPKQQRRLLALAQQLAADAV